MIEGQENSKSRTDLAAVATTVLRLATLQSDLHLRILPNNLACSVTIASIVVERPLETLTMEKS